jgi:hypothetical protein
MDLDPIARALGYIVLIAGGSWLLFRAVLKMARTAYLLVFFALTVGGIVFAGGKALLHW